MVRLGDGCFDGGSMHWTCDVENSTISPARKRCSKRRWRPGTLNAGDFALLFCCPLPFLSPSGWFPWDHLMMFKQIPYCFLALCRIGTFDYSGLLDFCWNMLEPFLTVLRHWLSSRPILAFFWQFFTRDSWFVAKHMWKCAHCQTCKSPRIVGITLLCRGRSFSSRALGMSFWEARNMTIQTGKALSKSNKKSMFANFKVV